MAVQSVKQADCLFGVLYRRFRARLGPAQVTVATALALARLVYRMKTPCLGWISPKGIAANVLLKA